MANYDDLLNKITKFVDYAYTTDTPEVRAEINAANNVCCILKSIDKNDLKTLDYISSLIHDKSFDESLLILYQLGY